jgi:hypothetical protein
MDKKKFQMFHVKQFQRRKLKLNLKDQKKIEKVEKARETFINHDLKFYEKANGFFVIKGVHFWATTNHWYDERTKIGRNGINSLLNYLQVN